MSPFTHFIAQQEIAHRVMLADATKSVIGRSLNKDVMLQIVDYLKANPKKTSAEIVAESGIDYIPNLTGVMASLSRLGLITSAGMTRRGTHVWVAA